MAEIRQREWSIPGQRTKRKAWGFTVTINGKRTVRQSEEWTKEQAQDALAKVLLQVDAPKADAASITLADAVERYKGTRTNRGNARSRGDRRWLDHLTEAFGAATLLSQITAAKISAYKAARFSGVSEHTGRARKAASVNRPLTILRHLLTLAKDEWDVLAVIPKVKREREPQGRIRWLEDDEEVRLLDACATSSAAALLPFVVVALNTGMRRSELFGMRWEEGVDMSRGVIRLEVTKSGKRREIPMRQVVYDTLAGLPGPHDGPVWPVKSIRTAYENAVRAAKLNSRFTFHDCRHHFASRWVMRGGSVTALQQVLGHATLAMTLRYAHLSPGHLRDEMARTERHASTESPAGGHTAGYRASEVPASG